MAQSVVNLWACKNGVKTWFVAAKTACFGRSKRKIAFFRRFLCDTGVFSLHFKDKFLAVFRVVFCCLKF
jgi:hypothetical protein